MVKFINKFHNPAKCLYLKRFSFRSWKKIIYFILCNNIFTVVKYLKGGSDVAIAKWTEAIFEVVKKTVQIQKIKQRQ